jgi:hypothetical protein
LGYSQSLELIRKGSTDQTAVIDPDDRINELKLKVRDAMEMDLRERTEEANRVEAELRELLAESRRARKPRIIAWDPSDRAD